MKNNNKTIQPRKPSHIRAILWTVYKSAFIGTAVYLCYQCLHIESDFTLTELFLCNLVLICFLAIIKYHASLKKIAEQPNQPVVWLPITLVGGVLSWTMYLGLYAYSLLAFDFMSKKTFYKPYILFLVVIYAVIPAFYNVLFTTE